MKISEFFSENFQFLVVKFLIHLNRRVFVMCRQVRFPRTSILSKLIVALSSNQTDAVLMLTSEFFPLEMYPLS